ncbi:MAG: dTDP-4-amino-4,6-dideoxy-D-glucose transaminase [Pirellulaceae bacterium]|nr:MAG: dTDP-4-amino-4,6-dideoxy-D-glucose transaminase [Pirellulaceae bacterium]
MDTEPPIHIPFNRPWIGSRERTYVAQALEAGWLAGDGPFGQRCAAWLQERFGVRQVLMTPSGTAALELAALLCDLRPGDEVLMPSFTFVSTANAVLRCGARPVFVEIRSDTLNLDESLLDQQATPRTRAVIPVHYAGVGCEMQAILDWARPRGVLVIEDAAQAVNASYRNRPLGSWGDAGVYSFHETKNYSCGEGGALCINRDDWIPRAHILRDKGTNRKQFLRGEVDRYTWHDIGSSFVAAELLMAFLWAQLEQMDELTAKRRTLFERYKEGLADCEKRGDLRLPCWPEHCQPNYHMFYVLTDSESARNALIAHLRRHGIQAVFHYVPLHISPMGRKLGYRAGMLAITERVSSCLLRLPMYAALRKDEQCEVIDAIRQFFGLG